MNMQLHLIVDSASCIHYSLEELISIAIESGIDVIQLREKKTSTLYMVRIAKQLKSLLQGSNVPLIINDRVDVAVTVEADGVHLGQSDLPYPAARAILGPKKIIGLTIETPDQAHSANQYDVNYIGVGPVFATNTKLDAPLPIGIKGLQEILACSHHPVIAIGGINENNLSEIVNTDIAGIAVASAISKAVNPAATIYSLQQLLDRGNII